MGKIAFRKDFDPPVFRKIAFGTWRTAGDPSVYAQIDLDMTRALAFAEKYSKEHNVKVTPSHLVAGAITHCLVERPEINGLIRRGKIYLRKHVSVFFQVNIPSTGPDKAAKANLSGVTLHEAEKMTLADICRNLAARAQIVKEMKDPSFNKSFKMVKALPWGGVKHFLNLTSYLLYELNLDLSALGFPKDPFGSVMVTNVGGMGIDLAWAPLCPYTKVPLLMTVGAVTPKPVAIDGKVEVRPVMSIGVTFDHRFMDGVHAAQMSREFKRCFAEPEQFFTRLGVSSAEQLPLKLKLD